MLSRPKSPPQARPKLNSLSNLPAYHDLKLPEEQVETLQSSWDQVVNYQGNEMHDGETGLSLFADYFYEALFDLDPNAKSLFDGAPFQTLAKAVMGIVGVVVKGAANLPALIPTVQKLGKRHVVYGVEQQHYENIPPACDQAFKRLLKEQYTDEVATVWSGTLTVLCNIMKEAASFVEIADRIKRKKKSLIWRNSYPQGV